LTINGLHDVISQKIELFNTIEYHLTKASFFVFVFYSSSITFSPSSPLSTPSNPNSVPLLVIPQLIFPSFACLSSNVLSGGTAHAGSAGDKLRNETRGIITAQFLNGCVCRQDLG
jgi:hypothetical protein